MIATNKDIASRIDDRKVDAMRLETNLDPLNLTNYARAHMVEQILALDTSGHRLAERRDLLNRMNIEELRRELALVTHEEWSTAA